MHLVHGFPLNIWRTPNIIWKIASDEVSTLEHGFILSIGKMETSGSKRNLWRLNHSGDLLLVLYPNPFSYFPCTHIYWGFFLGIAFPITGFSTIPANRPTSVFFFPLWHLKKKTFWRTVYEWRGARHNSMHSFCIEAATPFVHPILFFGHFSTSLICINNSNILGVPKIPARVQQVVTIYQRTRT